MALRVATSGRFVSVWDDPDIVTEQAGDMAFRLRFCRWPRTPERVSFGAVRGSSYGGLLLVLGLVMLGLFTFAVDLPSGLDFIAILVLGIVPAVVGLALIWARWRRPGRASDPEAQRLAGLKEQIIWRAVARGGEITVTEASAHSGVSATDAEHALMVLVAEGRARVEPGSGGEIVYRIDSPLPGQGSKS